MRKGHGLNYQTLERLIYQAYESRKKFILAVNKETSLKAMNLRKSYRKREVVRGISMEIKEGEIVGLLGPNGAGKTTTFSMIAGFVTPTAGKLEIGWKRHYQDAPTNRARRGLVYLPQESSIFRKLTVEDNIRAIVENLKDQ